MEVEPRTALRRFIYHAIILAGALSCVLVWFKIEPKDLWGWHVPLTIPHSVWLLLSILLFIIGLWASGQSLYRSVRFQKSFAHPEFNTISKRKFVNEVVEMDGNSFHDCHFKNTKLMYHGSAPTEIVGEMVMSDSVIVVTDNPALGMFLKLHQFVTSAPGAEIRDGENGPSYHKLLMEPDGFRESDPHVYLSGIIIESDGFPQTTLRIVNLSGGVAHNVSIEEMSFGYKKVLFPTVVNHMPLNVPEDIIPRVQNVPSPSNRSLLSVVIDAWNEHVSSTVTGTSVDERKLPLSIHISYEDASRARKLETVVDVLYSYQNQLLNEHHAERLKIKDYPVFEIKDTRFRVRI